MRHWKTVLTLDYENACSELTNISWNVQFTSRKEKISLRRSDSFHLLEQEAKLNLSYDGVHISRTIVPGLNNIKSILQFAIIFIFKMLNGSLKISLSGNETEILIHDLGQVNRIN